MEKYKNELEKGFKIQSHLINYFFKSVLLFFALLALKLLYLKAEYWNSCNLYLQSTGKDMI